MKLRKSALTALFALLCTLAMPLGAAEMVTPADSAAIEAPQQTEAVAEAAPAAPADLDLEALLDDGRQAMACNPTGCNASCEARFGEFASGFCQDGQCFCAV